MLGSTKQTAATLRWELSWAAKLAGGFLPRERVRGRGIGGGREADGEVDGRHGCG